MIEIIGKSIVARFAENQESYMNRLVCGEVLCAYKIGYHALYHEKDVFLVDGWSVQRPYRLRKSFFRLKCVMCKGT